MAMTAMAACTVAFWLGVCLATPASAVLGQSSATIEQDRQRLEAVQTTQTKKGYTVHALESPGASIREYVSAEGIVYGLAWKHHSGLLDLEALFGPYYSEYSQAVVEQPRPRQHQRITTEHLIVEKGGRMGDVWGRAWVLPLMPQGLSEDHIQ